MKLSQTFLDYLIFTNVPRNEIPQHYLIGCSNLMKIKNVKLENGDMLLNEFSLELYYWKRKRYGKGKYQWISCAASCQVQVPCATVI